MEYLKVEKFKRVTIGQILDTWKSDRELAGAKSKWSQLTTHLIMMEVLANYGESNIRHEIKSPTNYGGLKVGHTIEVLIDHGELNIR